MSKPESLFIVVVFAVSVISVIIWLHNRRSRPRIGEIAPADVFQKKYKLYAENRPTIVLDPSKVPEDLRALIPLAEKWGIGDDIIRNDFIRKSSAAEKKELHDALYEPFERITEWLDSQGGSGMTDEADAFMFMQGSLDEMGIYILEEKKGKRRQP